MQGQLVSHLEKDKIKSILHHTQELNSKWIINSNVKKIEGKRAIQILEENMYEFFLNFGIRKKSLTVFQKSETIYYY